MGLFSFESPGGYKKLIDQVVVADTSYLIQYPLDPNLITFHQQCLNDGIMFLTNVTVRWELFDSFRHAMIVHALLRLAAADSNEKRAIITHPKLRSGRAADTFEDTVENNYDILYKHYLKNDDFSKLTKYFRKNIWGDVQKTEDAAGVYYEGGAASQNLDDKPQWSDLGVLMENTGLAAKDCMIANFAVAMKAAAVMTMDTDFCQAAQLIDVYMPNKLAKRCPNHVPSADK